MHFLPKKKNILTQGIIFTSQTNHHNYSLRNLKNSF